VCGGCAWQHIDYQCQLVQKEQWVRHLFAPLGLGSSAFHPIIGCSDPWGYRNKMEFSFSQDREGKRFLGLFARQRRRTVFDLKECYLVNPWMAETLHHIREWWSMSNLAAYRPETDDSHSLWQSIFCLEEPSS
jgi:23S rRNA (uracil1939-C5)-methyltransferase